MKRTWTRVRRITQVVVLMVFLATRTDWRGVTGNLSSSRVFGLALADPLAVLQIFLAQHRILPVLLPAAGFTLLMYWLLGGRTFCGWVCPVNTLLEGVDVVRKRCHLPDTKLGVSTKYWILIIILAVSVFSRIPAFEMVSPIGILMRNLLYGFGWSFLGIVILIGFELTVSRRGFCRYLCPLGAFYGLIGRISPLHLRFNTTRCINCGECEVVCPMGEAPLSHALAGQATRIDGAECIKCMRCLEVCPTQTITPGFGMVRTVEMEKDHVKI
jgi:ferredoxin-type protein NapH